jgi:hypothetical protein
MFCPHCGFEYSHKTNFCKSCGGNLGAPGTAEPVTAPRPKITLMFWAIATLGMVGLLADFITYYNLARDGLRGDALLIPFVMGLMFTGGVVALLAWQLSRIVSAWQRTAPSVVVERHYIREAPPPQIGAPTDPIARPAERPSVVEHTTRQMANAHREATPR